MCICVRFVIKYCASVSHNWLVHVCHVLLSTCTLCMQVWSVQCVLAVSHSMYSNVYRVSVCSYHEVMAILLPSLV